MIRYDQTGVTLFYIDSNGTRVSRYFMDGAAYSAMLDIRSAQLQAMAENTAATNDYNQKLAGEQKSIDEGRGVGLTAPTKPLAKGVSDTGVVTSAPFDPPLADLVYPKITPSQVNTAADAMVNRSIPPTSAATDSANSKIEIMYNMILAMFRKTFPDA